MSSVPADPTIMLYMADSSSTFKGSRSKAETSMLVLVSLAAKQHAQAKGQQSCRCDTVTALWLIISFLPLSEAVLAQAIFVDCCYSLPNVHEVRSVLSR